MYIPQNSGLSELIASIIKLYKDKIRYLNKEVEISFEEAVHCENLETKKQVRNITQNERH